MSDGPPVTATPAERFRAIDWTPEMVHALNGLTREDVALIQAARSVERERCAKIAESVSGAWEQCGKQIAETIRRAR